MTTLNKVFRDFAIFAKITTKSNQIKIKNIKFGKVYSREICSTKTYIIIENQRY